MALEKACAGEESLGRIIPTPQEISAGCGLSWCAPTEAEAALTALCAKRGIAYAGMTTVRMYG